MKSPRHILETLLLLTSGGLLILIGGMIITTPETFYAANGIHIANNINLLKAPAGFLLAAGSVMIVATIKTRLRPTALTLATLLYLTYATARLVSIVTDGMPTEGLLQATALEAILGIACLVLVWSQNDSVRQPLNRPARE